MTYKALARSLATPALLLAAAFTPALAQNGGDDRSGKLEGTWITTVTRRDCNTGGAVGGAATALNTFNRGGTMIDTTTLIGPAQRSPGLGTWERTGGDTYSAVSIAFIFDAAGVWTQTQKLIHSLTVNGNALKFDSTVVFYDAAGNVVRTGCATAVAERLLL